MVLTGYTAKTMFKNIQTQDPEMKKQLELTKKYALSEQPIVIYSESGTEYFKVAEAIHNGSAHQNCPFVSANLEAMSEEEQMRSLFGKNMDATESTQETIFFKAQQGTIFLNSIDKLGERVQQRLYSILLDRAIGRTDIALAELCHARIIVSTKKNLKKLVEEGIFSENLFYLLQGLTLHVPPLRERKEDTMMFFEKLFSDNCKKYNKYLVLSMEALRKVSELPWLGNHLQLQTFCETLVIRMDRRKVDEVVIQQLYNNLYPEIKTIEGRNQMVIYKTKESEEITRLLELYYGNRSAVAKELGISTTTLWRKMKKYGITDIKK